MRVHLRQGVQQRARFLEHHDWDEAIPRAAELGSASEPALPEELPTEPVNRHNGPGTLIPGPPFCFGRTRSVLSPAAPSFQLKR